MIKHSILILLGILVFNSCKQSQEKIKVDWVFVEGGRFEQGKNQFVVSPKGDTIKGFTSPHRFVEISDFYISKYEITVEQFKEFYESTGRKMPEPPNISAYGDTIEYKWKDNYPMLATWNESNEFAKWAGARLATEAEWEYAAKGGQKSRGFKYSGSNDPMEVGWVQENSDSTLRVGGNFKPNELGIYDMTGNVNEWVADWYNPELDSTSELIDPKGPIKGDSKNQKISKGVGWYYASTDEKGMPLEYGIHMPEVRYQSPIETRTFGFGFRIVKN